MKNKVIALLVAIVLATSFLACTLYEESIHSATIEELESVNGIGEVLANRISLYLSENPEANVHDLIEVQGIGEVKIKQLDRKWK